MGRRPFDAQPPYPCRTRTASERVQGMGVEHGDLGARRGDIGVRHGLGVDHRDLSVRRGDIGVRHGMGVERGVGVRRTSTPNQCSEGSALLRSSQG